MTHAKLRTQTLGLPRTVERCYQSAGLPESWRPSTDYVSAARLGLVGRSVFALAADVQALAEASEEAENAEAVQHAASLALPQVDYVNSAGPGSRVRLGVVP